MRPVAPERAKRLGLGRHEQHDTQNSRQHRDRLQVLQHFVHGREIQRSAPSRRRFLASGILPVAPKSKATQGTLARFRNPRDLVIYLLLPRTILCGDAGPYRRKETILIWAYRSPIRRSGTLYWELGRATHPPLQQPTLRGTPSTLAQGSPAGIASSRAKLLLDANQLIILCDSIGATEGACLDLPCVCGNRDIRDG